MKIPTVRIAALGLVVCACATLLACTPSGQPQVAPSNPPSAAAPAEVAPAAAPEPTAVPEPPPPPEPVQKPMTKKGTHKPKPVVAAAPPPPPPPPVVAVPPAPVVHAPPPPPVCTNCGVIAAITPVAVQGKGTGLGAVAGGVAGLVIGNQIGAGSGKTIAKIAGVAGGAFVGNKVEQKARAATHYEIRVHLDNGTDTAVTQDSQPTLPVGAAVRVVDGVVIAK